MTRRSRFVMFAFLLGAHGASLVTGCIGTETGNPPVAPITMALRTSDPSVASPGSGPGIVVDEAWIALTSAAVIDGAACDHVATRASVENVSGDLARGVPTNGVPIGPLCGLRLTLQPGVPLPTGAPVAFGGRALLVRGRGPDGVAFEVAVEAATTLDLRSAGGADLGVTTGDAFVLTWDVARWLSGVALGAIVPDADGVRRIELGDPELAAFTLGFASSAELFADADGDGALDPAEAATGAVAVSH